MVIVDTNNTGQNTLSSSSVDRMNVTVILERPPTALSSNPQKLNVKVCTT